MSFRALCKRLACALSARATEEELDRELESHIQFHIEDNLRSGMSPEEARRQAILKLGGLEHTKQVYRDRTTIPFIESLLQDARFALRIFARRPALSTLIVVVLALGIGGNTAMFSMVNAVLLRPLPYRDSNRLVVVWQSGNQHRTTGEWFDTYREFEEWQRNSRSFEKLAALSWATTGKSLVWRGKSQSVLVIPASVGLFSMLGVSASIGRTFEPHDLSEDCTLVLSHTFWQNQLGGTRDLVGQSLPLDQQECRVIGIMPRDFSFYPTQTALWMLITPNTPFVKDAWRSVTGVFGRLKPGISRTAAQSELEILERNILPEAPADLSLPQAVPVVLDLQSEFTWLAGRNLRTALLVLLAAVFCVLLIACINVANLLLAQTATRQREFAIRASLGAGRRRLIRQLLIESTLLSSGGAFLAILMAFAVIRIFHAKTPIELPPGNSVELNWQVLLFTAFLAILCAVLFGVAPAWRASRLDVHHALKEAGRNSSRVGRAPGAQSLVVACEIGLSFILLAGAGLLIQSLARLASAPLGFRTDHLLVGSLRLSDNRYRDPEQKIRFYDEMREQLASIPGVRGVSLASSLYLTGSNVLAVQGRTFSRDSAPHNVASQSVDHQFLEIMGIPLLRGRRFDTRDRRNTQPVAIINQALADQYFPNQDPTGREIKLGPPEDQQPWLTIVGVAGNVKTTTVFQEMGYVVFPAVYRLFVQQPSPSLSFFVRTDRDPEAIVNPLEQRPLFANDVTLANVKTMDESLSELRSQPRFRTIVLSAFAALALVLASVGIYGVLTQSVVHRTREIGVRMALGATRGGVMRLILKHALTTILLGLGVGLPLSAFFVRIVAGLLYDVRAENPLLFAGVAALLLCVSMVSSYLPARRATAIDPWKALRTE